MHSTRASRSLSSVPTFARYAVGPLQVTVSSVAGVVAEQVDRTLGLYDVRWPFDDTVREVWIEFGLGDGRPGHGSAPAAGRYLACAQMMVDPAPGGLYASTLSTGVVRAEFGPDGERWQAVLETVGEGPELPAQVEDVLTLAVATGWRRAGWVPLHAAGLVGPGRRGLICCASSGGGKTTFVMAMLRRGWRLLGDDKLLLGRHGQAAHLVALQHSLNVDPRSRGWFPDLEGTPDPRPPLMPLIKQRVLLSDGGPDWRSESVEPTDVVLLRRDAEGGVRIARLSPAETLSALLRQTVIPGDRALAAGLIGTIARTAESCRGWVVSVGEEAYELPTALDEVEQMLR